MTGKKYKDKIIKTLILISFLFLFLSCLYVKQTEKKYKIDNKKYDAVAKSERIRHIIIHYTYADDALSLKLLTGENVSSHYLITSRPKEPIYNLVDEKYRAWHAGESTFEGRVSMNDTSIGIEIVHNGYNILGEMKNINKDDLRFISYDSYVSYDEVQIEKLAFLLKEIIKKYNIHPKNILGHSDVAPTRKQDPGPKFPWKMLYDKYSIGIWYDYEDYTNFLNDGKYKKASVSNIKYEFIKYGYSSMPTNNIWDLDSRLVLYAFQMRFRPENIKTEIDEEIYAIIRSLNEKVKKIEATNTYFLLPKKSK